MSEYPLPFHLQASPDLQQYKSTAVCRRPVLLHFLKNILSYHNLHPVPELPEDIPSEADLYLPHVPSAYCSSVYHMDYTDKTNDTLPDSRKNHLDHSSIQHMDSHEKPVDPLLLSAVPVQLHIF